MKSLIIIAHGSRDEAANEDFIALVDEIRAVTSAHYAKITHAFLEFAAPNLTTAVHQMVERGCRDILVYPWFLSAGKHVGRDIQEQAEKLQAEFPACRIGVLEHFGAVAEIPRLMVRHIESQTGQDKH